MKAWLDVFGPPVWPLQSFNCDPRGDPGTPPACLCAASELLLSDRPLKVTYVQGFTRALALHDERLGRIPQTNHREHRMPWQVIRNCMNKQGNT